MSHDVNPEKVIARMAQQIANLSAENAMLSVALEDAQERIAEIEKPDDDKEKP